MIVEKQSAIKIVHGNYKLKKKIDEGAFGKIYQAFDTRQKDNSPNYAVKIEALRDGNAQLVFECKIYNYLMSDPEIFNRGIPQVFACGVEGQFNYLVMELMGPSLESLFQAQKCKLSLKTVLMLMDQMLMRIEYIHSRQIIHRDIKPDNFCMGVKKNSRKMYLLDFGLAKKYTSKDGYHIPFRQGKSLTGTARYASVNTHIGYEQSRRDDLESILFVCIYLLKGILPWQGLKGANKEEKYQRIKDKKIRTKVEELCKNCPTEFAIFITSIRNLKFDEKPNYGYYREIFSSLFQKNNFKYDYIYDWTLLNYSDGKTSGQTFDNRKLCS